ncbi:hypothetical protein [Moorena sp. SIO3H5]|uniref:hypothetical protein n=1 Tax=Moorena sp. SIO3H5 TaxID=2607834 RepID=UPI0013BE60E2|nr:hypothetical protein [Moorena sp. SIO3H5]NEO73939.1 hypothetical protein [Moorena sp. SIO3H5]
MLGSRESGAVRFPLANLIRQRKAHRGNRQSMTLQPRYSDYYPNEVHIILCCSLFPVPCSLLPAPCSLLPKNQKFVPHKS